MSNPIFLHLPHNIAVVWRIAATLKKELYEDHSARCRQGRAHAPLHQQPAQVPAARRRKDHHRLDRGRHPATRPHRDHLHHRLQGRSHGPLPSGQARMGQDPHRTPERPAGPGAGNKPRAPLHKRRRTPAHNTRRHPVRRGPQTTRGRKRERAVHLQGAGSPTLRRGRHRRERAFPAAQGRALAARSRGVTPRLPRLEGRAQLTSGPPGPTGFDP